MAADLGEPDETVIVDGIGFPKKGGTWMNRQFASLLDELHSLSTPCGNTPFSRVWNEPSQRALEWATEHNVSASEFERSRVFQDESLFGHAISLRQLRHIQKLITLHEKIEAGDSVRLDVYDITLSRYSLPAVEQVEEGVRNWNYRGPEASREELLGALQAIDDIADHKLETDAISAATVSQLRERAGRALEAADEETKYLNQEIVEALSRIHTAYRDVVIVDQGALTDGEHLASWAEQVEFIAYTAFGALEDLDREEALREIDLRTYGWDRGLSDLVHSTPAKGREVLEDALIERGALIQEHYQDPDTRKVVIQYENAPGTYIFTRDGASHTPLGFTDALRAMGDVGSERSDYNLKPVESVKTEFRRRGDSYEIDGHQGRYHVRISWSETLQAFEVSAYQPSSEVVYRQTEDSEWEERGPDEYVWGTRDGDERPLKTVQELKSALTPYAVISDHTAQYLEEHRQAWEQGVEPCQRIDTSRELLTEGLVFSLRQISDLRSNNQDGIKTWSHLSHGAIDIACNAIRDYKVKTSILEALSDGRQHSTAGIVKCLTGSGTFEREEVKRAFLELADSYAIAPQRHNHPDNPVHGDISLMPRNARGSYYIGASLHNGLELQPVPAGDKTLLVALQDIINIKTLTPNEYSWKGQVIRMEEIARDALNPPGTG